MITSIQQVITSFPNGILNEIETAGLGVVGMAGTLGLSQSILNSPETCDSRAVCFYHRRCG